MKAVASASSHSPAAAASSSHMRSASSDDVTTKSITGLESLVDQIPAIAENDSGVFSGSGAGSHPNTPRSVGPYSPATTGGGAAGNGNGQNFSPFHTPPFNVPSTSESAVENSTSYHHPPTDFSVNSLVHQGHQQRSFEAVTSAALPMSSFADTSSSAFSVSSLTSSYANDMASKYAAANNPYASSFLGSQAAAAAGFFAGQPNSFTGSMGPSMAASMAHGAMSYYGQYSNTYGAGSAAAASAAAAASFAPSPYSAYMPNPGYHPYSHHYGQSPYSQSPYF